jgi:predicted PurR-regulated permease PerM
MPKVVGQKVGLPPIVAIFAVMAGSVAFGVLGMIIAVPLAGCIKLALMQFMPKLFEQPEDESGKER